MWETFVGYFEVLGGSSQPHPSPMFPFFLKILSRAKKKGIGKKAAEPLLRCWGDPVSAPLLGARPVTLPFRGDQCLPGHILATSERTTRTEADVGNKAAPSPVPTSWDFWAGGRRKPETTVAPPALQGCRSH
ncbi:Transcription Initiation Factor Tfiid Subunit 8 [Manis pentadactyla]|nr:Transcription Initiation Factor Tfiid Subunit 8 [Manis pentadactyla]